MEKGRQFSLFWARWGGFHGRMAVCGDAALGRAGVLFIRPISLALRARLVFARALLLGSSKASLAPALSVSAVSHVTSS